MKLALGNIVAAIIAGATAFGASYDLAATDGIQLTEWINIAFATVSGVLGALYHNKKVV